MEGKNMWAAIGGAIVLIAALAAWGLMDAKQAQAPAPDDGKIIYYYGEECPHCKNVAKFLEENKIAEKVDFVKKEVWHNPSQSREMQQRAASCQVSKEKIGVPFIFAEGKCIIGEPEVIDFFKKAAGLEQSE